MAGLLMNCAHLDVGQLSLCLPVYFGLSGSCDSEAGLSGIEPTRSWSADRGWGETSSGYGSWKASRYAAFEKSHDTVLRASSERAEE